MLTRVVLITTALASAQSPISYVASVRQNNSADARALMEYSAGGRLSATAVTVRALLRTAYRVQDYQIAGAPAWFSTKRYDIAAKVDDTPAPSNQVFLRTLLADRFSVVVHTETGEMPTFALVVARSGKLIPSDFDCAAYAASPHALPVPGKTPDCAARANMGAFSGKAISMPQLATSLGAFAERFTVDKTGLAGRFDVELTWDDAAGPSLVTAIQEQLGLKLVSEKGPVAVLVVDRAAEPSAN
jgi:uncharacterized protein (TIGR03435 family)